jgi:dynein heavy chain
MERFNRLLRIVSTSLAELKRAIRGEVLMSLELDKMYSSMLNNQVPALWERYAYPSRKPLASWMADLHQRIAFMREWLRHGQPKSFWLSGFFFPQGFLTGALQTFARKYQVAIDTLNFRFSVLDAMEPADIAEVPEDGVLIHGLFLDGARWDREARLLEDSRIGELNTAMPIIHFMPTVNHTPDPKDYVCPVYKTSVRAGVLSTTGQSTNFVIAVELPSRRAPDYWVLKGAAMLCQLNT